jgi:phospho-N-acetylmuramoyl-pentapeptide-transferase
MWMYALEVLAAFATSFVLYLLILPLLKKLKAGQYILSYVKEHKEKGGTPTMGGLAFVVAIVVVGLGFYGLYDRKVNLTLAITAGFAVVGFLDDFLKIYRKENEGLKPYQKIIFQLAIAVVAAVYCYVNGLTKLTLPFSFGKSVDFGWVIIPFTLFVFLATVNCVNLTDGLDGLAGSTSIAFLLAVAALQLLEVSGLSGTGTVSGAGTVGLLNVVGQADGDSFADLSFISCGALAAFLVFNTNKAAVFMGDTGSLALGGLLSCICVFSGNTLFIPLFGVMFVLSGISVIVQVIYYKRTKRRLFLMAPLHHHFQMKGYTECRISYIWCLITVLVSLFTLMFV